LVELTDVLLVSAVVSTVIGLILYLAMRGQYSGLRASVGQLNDIQTPQVRGRLDELARYSDVGRLKEQFQTFGQDIVNRIDSMKRLCRRAGERSGGHHEAGREAKRRRSH
jgi:predicted esterase